MMFSLLQGGNTCFYTHFSGSWEVGKLGSSLDAGKETVVFSGEKCT